MSVVGIDFGALHSKVSGDRASRLRLRTRSPAASFADWCCKTPRHRHHHQRGFEPPDSVGLCAPCAIICAAAIFSVCELGAEWANLVCRSLVSFGPKQRAIGEPAKNLEISNFRNTVGSLKRLLGRTISDPEISEVESKYTHVKLVDANGTVGAQVRVL